jgi:hypothetical protein
MHYSYGSSGAHDSNPEADWRREEESMLVIFKKSKKKKEEKKSCQP